MGGIFVPSIAEDLDDIPTRTGQGRKLLRVNSTATAFEYASLPWVSVAEAPFNAVGDGVTDDSTAIQAALDSFGTDVAGTVVVPSTHRCVIDSTITMPNFVNLVSFTPVLGTENSIWSHIETSGPILYVNPSATILVNEGNRISGLKILKKGIIWNESAANFPTFFVGDAITLNNNSNDCIIEDCIIGGFNYGIRTATGGGFQRLRLFRLMMDNLNCVSLEYCSDVTYIDQVHCWPFVTVMSPAAAGSAQINRSGAAIQLLTHNDWTKITDCFNFGYHIGYDINIGAGHTHLIGCSSDTLPVTTDPSIGFNIDGGWATVLVGCHVSAKDIGCKINGGGLMDTQLIGFNTQAVRTASIQCTAGKTFISGGYLYDSTTSSVGVDIQSGVDSVTMDSVTFGNQMTAIQSSSTMNKVHHRNCNFVGVFTAVTNPYQAAIGSASTINPDGTEMFYRVDGTNNITAIANAAAYASKQLTLRFTSILTVVDNGTTLNLAGDLITASGTILVLTSDGTNWMEVSRSVN